MGNLLILFFTFCKCLICSLLCNDNAFPFAIMQVTDERVTEGILVMEGNKKPKLLHQDELLLLLGKEKHSVDFAYCCSVQWSKGIAYSPTLQTLFSAISNEISEEGSVLDKGEYLQVKSFRAALCCKEACPYRVVDDGSEAVFVCCSWSAGDEELAWKIIEKFRVESTTGI